MLKLNLHVTETCNYRCRHCFSAFGRPPLRPVADWKRVLERLEAFDPKARVNFAGGEPLLYPGIEDLIKHADALGLQPSIITNGSAPISRYLEIAPHLETFGVSVDSLDPDISRRIGRCDPKDRVLREAELSDLFAGVRKRNPALRLKVNTVVTAENKADSSLPDAIRRWRIDRWKILRCKHFACSRFDNSDACVLDEEFDRFSAAALSVFGLEHQSDRVLYRTSTGQEIVVEDTLAGTYLFADPAGNLLDNSAGNCHQIVANLFRDDIETALRQVNFNRQLFDARYAEEV